MAQAETRIPHNSPTPIHQQFGENVQVNDVDRSSLLDGDTLYCLIAPPVVAASMVWMGFQPTASILGCLVGFVLLLGVPRNNLIPWMRCRLNEPAIARVLQQYDVHHEFRGCQFGWIDLTNGVAVAYVIAQTEMLSSLPDGNTSPLPQDQQKLVVATKEGVSRYDLSRYRVRVDATRDVRNTKRAGKHEKIVLEPLDGADITLTIPAAPDRLADYAQKLKRLTAEG